MAKGKSRGRPPLPKDSGKEARLFCRMLKSELEEIQAAAEKAEKTTSDFIRETLLAAARKRTE